MHYRDSRIFRPFSKKIAESIEKDTTWSQYKISVRKIDSDLPGIVTICNLYTSH